MAVKRLRRIMQNISFLSHENLMENRKSCRRSSRSGLNLSNFSSPKATLKNASSAQHNKVRGSPKMKLKQVAPSDLQSSFHKYPETRQKINKIKQGQAQSNSLHILLTPTLDRTRKRSGNKMQRKHSTEVNKNSSRLSFNTLETSVLTRSQKKLLNSGMELLSKRKDHISDICSMNPVTYLPKVCSRKGRSLVRDMERINSQTETSRQTSLENMKTPISACSLRKSFDINANASKQNKNMSIPSATVSLVYNSVLSQEKVESRIEKRRYHLRSQSEKIFNPLKPAIHSGKRRKSTPIDDLVCMTSKPVSKRNKEEICVSKPISNITPDELNTHNSECKVLKISSKKSLEKEKSKGLPRKTILSGKPISSIDSKMNKSTKRKRSMNRHSVDIDSNLIINYRTTRSSVLPGKSMDSKISLPSKKFENKSKRHTFPMLNGKYSVSSPYHLRTNQEANGWKLNLIDTLNHSNSFNHKNVPIDDLTVTSNSFLARTCRPGSKCATSVPIKHISIKVPSTQDKNQVSNKSRKATKHEKKKTSNYQEKCSLDLQNKIPCKGTLKRKRWIFNTLKERNDGYEDDIFEKNEAFEKMKAALEISDDESDTTDVSIATPKCGFILTPSLPKKTPLYKECISSKELLEARKVAEEYLFRRNKKWKSEIKDDFDKQNSVNTNGTSKSEQDLPEKKKLDYMEVLNNVVNAQKDIENLIQESEEEDAYFSEVSD